MVKKMFDVMVSFLALVITSPLFLVVSVLVFIDSGWPVFFVQNRVGKGGKVFKFLKFRTMIQGAPNIGLGLAVAHNDSRITRVGKFLREWTIDEIPQFINILRGDMSFVGPRPLTPYTGSGEKLKKIWEKRNSVKPGLVSLVDAKGRNLVSWEKRFEYDLWYIDHQSFWLDIKILIKVFFVVLSRKGVYDEGGVNKPPQ